MPEAVDSEVGGSCEPGTLGAIFEGVREPGAELSAGGSFVLAEASANFAAMS